MNARAKEPKPPRVTPPEPESEETADGDRLDEESPLKNNDDEPRPPPPDEDPRGGHPALVCKSAATPGRFGPQFSSGIST